MNRNLKSNILLITYSAVLIAFFMNVGSIINFIKRVTLIMAPFTYGLVLAYIINWPYTFISNKLVNIKHKKTISLISAYAFIIGIVAFLIGIVIPQVIFSMANIVNMWTEFYPTVENWVNDVPFSTQIKQLLNNFWNRWDSHFENAFTSIFHLTKDFTVSFYNWVIGFIISIYMLAGKEKLFRMVKRLVVVYLPKRITSIVFEIFSVTCDVFDRFIKGKTLDSVIIGILCFIGMTIFNMPYAVLISVFVGFTNIIPFFGPFFGAIPSIIIMMVVDPVKAIWFAVFVFILQQIDGNVIGPKILGDSMGISGIFIIFSVLFGGGLFGVPGMVLGVPVFSVIYTILGRITKNKEKTIKLKTTDS